jgi:hypothetical protein
MAGKYHSAQNRRRFGQSGNGQSGNGWSGDEWSVDAHPAIWSGPDRGVDSLQPPTGAK